MIALDTNVLVRFLVDDDAEQSTRAARLIERAAKHDEPLFVSDVVLAEVAWVLTRAYHFTKDDLLPVLRSLVRARHLSFTSSDVVATAIDGWAKGKGDFTDYLVRAQALARGCEQVATFDRALLKDRAFFSP